MARPLSDCLVLIDTLAGAGTFRGFGSYHCAPRPSPRGISTMSASRVRRAKAATGASVFILGCAARSCFSPIVIAAPRAYYGCAAYPLAGMFVLALGCLLLIFIGAVAIPISVTVIGIASIKSAGAELRRVPNPCGCTARQSPATQPGSAAIDREAPPAGHERSCPQ